MAWKRYPAYRDSGVAWLGEVPEGWAVDKIKNVIYFNPESLSDTTPPDHLIEYIDISNVNSGGRILEIAEMEFSNAPSRARRIVKKGDTIISTVRTYLKAIALITSPSDRLIASTGFAVLRPMRSFIDPKFLCRAVQAEPFVQTIERFSTGVSYPAITPSILSSLPIPIPPLPEQQTIADFLSRETARIDALIARKERLIALLQEKRAALISRAVTKGLDPSASMKDSGIAWLGEVPAHWGIKKVKFLFENFDSRRIPLSSEERSSREKVYPYYGASGIIDMVDDYIFDEPLLLVAEDGANLLSRSTPLAFIAEGKYWVNNHAHILKNRSGPMKFWEGLLQIYDYTPLITGSAQPKLTAERLGEIPLPSPPLDEQEEIAVRIHSISNETDKKAAIIVDSVRLLSEYRTALISAAVTGKIDVRGEVSA